MEWYDNLNPVDALENECRMCGAEIQDNKDFCSRSCFEEDNR
tara:strand:- start:546 stop:671 length:126 start_codon:yes stop_codon:yes gene_type:complete